MSRSYPIWHDIENCSYQSNKSYGNKNYGKETIFVGSSFKNKFKHCVIEHKKTITKKYNIDPNNEIMLFQTFINKKLVCETYFSIDEKGRADKFILNR